MVTWPCVRAKPWVLIGLLCAGLAACAPAGPSGPRAWIDFPLDNSELLHSEEITVVSHAHIPGGVAEILLAVNGVPYRRDPSAALTDELASASQSWKPEGSGDYLLEVVAYDADGRARASAASWVHILPADTATPEPTTTPIPTEPPPTVPPTVPPTIPPTPFVTFYADKTALTEGGCTTLRWRAENAVSASLDGATVALVGEQSVCPTSTRTYRLSVIALAGPVSRDVTVSVSAPADTAPPAIESVSASTDTVHMPNCTPNTVTIQAQVSDSGGVDKVKLIYRVTGGSWVERSMDRSGGSYQVTLDWGDLEASRDPVPTSGGAGVEYYIRARDEAGNTSESGVRSIGLAGCLI